MRLSLLKPILVQQASKRWSAHASQTERVLDVMQGGLTWIIGTIYMEMSLKPQVLQDLVADVNLANAIPSRTWRDIQKDVIQLEDESGRICIVGQNLQEHLLCTGIVVAVLGSETSSEEFDVIDIIYPGTLNEIPELEAETTPRRSTNTSAEPNELSSTPSNLEDESSGGEYVAFLSGLNLDGSSRSLLSLSLLTDWLNGELLLGDDQLLSSKLTTLVIVGNSIQPNSLVHEDAMSRRLGKNKKYGYDSASFDSRPLQILDQFLQDICQTLDVVLMPGSTDPTNTTLPQQAFNSMLFKDSSQYGGKTLRLATNPTFLQLGNKFVFGVSGQTVDDISHYIYSASSPEVSLSNSSGIIDSNEALWIAEHTLKWKHYAPTAPDTLWTYPYSDQDPFLMDDYPDLYIVGNQKVFAEKVVPTGTSSQSGEPRSCKIIALPQFSDNAELVLLNLKTMSAEVIVFA